MNYNTNLYRRLLAILPEHPTDVGVIIEITQTGFVVEMLGGRLVSAKGSGTINDIVYVRDNTIIGKAPALNMVEIEV